MAVFPEFKGLLNYQGVDYKNINKTLRKLKHSNNELIDSIISKSNSADPKDIGNILDNVRGIDKLMLNEEYHYTDN